MISFEGIERDEIDDIYSAMTENFTYDELRSRSAAEAILDNPDYAVYHVMTEHGKTGFVCVWLLNDTAFIEHFVIYEPFRNRGFGGAAIRKICEKFGKVILEVEKPEDDVQKRRIEFYVRNGFALNTQPYAQPPYRDGSWVPMHIMSYPSPLTDFDATVEKLYAKVYHVEYRPRKNGGEGRND